MAQEWIDRQTKHNRNSRNRSWEINKNIKHKKGSIAIFLFIKKELRKFANQLKKKVKEQMQSKLMSCKWMNDLNYF